MSGVLLDTHVALWLVADPGGLGERARSLLSTRPVWVSAVCLWEVAIKHQLGKLTMDADLAAALRGAGARELALNWSHASGYAATFLTHRDPFDRMLVTQARAAGLDFVTADRAILASDLPFVVDARL